VKYWIKPDLENRIKTGQITAYFNSTVEAIGLDEVVLNTPDGEVRLANDFVFAMTGYHPDFTFLRSLGVEFRNGNTEGELRPISNLETLESNVPGIYLAGVIVAGTRTNEIFIENGRFHGRQIAEDVRRKLTAMASAQTS
jgi:thioredoxin reductase (NADPH)